MKDPASVQASIASKDSHRAQAPAWDARMWKWVTGLTAGLLPKARHQPFSGHNKYTYLQAESLLGAGVNPLFCYFPFLKEENPETVENTDFQALKGVRLKTRKGLAKKCPH